MLLRAEIAAALGHLAFASSQPALERLAAPAEHDVVRHAALKALGSWPGAAQDAASLHRPRNFDGIEGRRKNV